MGILNNTSGMKRLGISSVTSKSSANAAIQEEVSAKLELNLSATKFAWILTIIALSLTFLSVAGHTLQYFLGRDQLFELVRLFNLGDEQNIPTWYTSATLLLCTIFLAYIAATKKRLGLPYTTHWSALSIIFLFLSIDAIATIHDRTIERPLIELLNPRGFLHFPWVIPGTILVLLLAIFYSRFLFHLPTKTRFLFIVAAFFYIGGGLALEMVSAYLMDYHVHQILLRGLVATSQEFFEMVGIIIFIYALVTYIGLHLNTIQDKLDVQQPDMSQLNELGSR